MLKTKKTIRRNVHGSEAAYSGTVTVVTHKTIVVFIPALDVDVDVQRNPQMHPSRTVLFTMQRILLLCSSTFVAGA